MPYKTLLENREPYLEHDFLGEKMKQANLFQGNNGKGRGSKICVT